MKKNIKILLIILSLVLILGILAYPYLIKEPIFGESCGTVNPDNRDECCYMKLKDSGMPRCPYVKIFYNLETVKCDFECGGAEDIFCTVETKQCPDGSWTSRTPALNCKFIPCGYN